MYANESRHAYVRDVHQLLTSENRMLNQSYTSDIELIFEYLLLKLDNLELTEKGRKATQV